MHNKQILKKRSGKNIAIVVPSHKNILKEGLEEPLINIVATLTSALSLGKVEAIQIGGRLTQALIQGKFKKQIAEELIALRDQGKIDNDYIGSNKGFKSFSDLLISLEEEVMDEEKFNAVKAAFYAINALNLEEKERAYYTLIFNQIRKLSSTQILILSISYKRYKTKGGFHNSDKTAWLTDIALQLGHQSTEILEIEERGLMEYRLLSPRKGGDQSGIDVQNARLTKLGIDTCKILEKYTYSELIK